MDIQTLKQRTPEGLKQDLKESIEQLKALEFKLSSHQLKNVRDVRHLKKTIARIQTFLAKNPSV